MKFFCWKIKFRSPIRIKRIEKPIKVKPRELTFEDEMISVLAKEYYNKLDEQVIKDMLK